MKKLFLLPLLVVLFGSCENEETKVDEVTLLTNNENKSWQVTDVVSQSDDFDVDKCEKDDIWEFVQDGWKYVNWKLTISPGFLKCDLEERPTQWNWKFNADFTELYITSIDDPSDNFIRKFDIMQLDQDEMVLQLIDENEFGSNFEVFTIFLRAKD